MQLIRALALAVPAWCCPSTPLLGQCAAGYEPLSTPHVAAYQPLTHACAGRHCVYSTPLRGGLSLVTTPRFAERVQDLVEQHKLADEKDHLGAPADFYEAQIPGKGVGLVANRTIRRGERIMAQTPALVVQLLLHNTMALGPNEDGLRLYAEAVRQLPEPRRSAFSRQVGDGLHDILDKNCFRMGLGGDPAEGAHLGCFVESARFNHDCRPNTQYHIRNLVLTTVAVRDISPGEELSISYVEATMPRAERQERLDSWGFRCSCAQCAASEADVVASDARVLEIARLREALDGPDSDGVGPESGDELVALYQRERLDMYLGGAHTRAALNYALFGQHDRAREHAALAAEALERQYGPDMADIESMRTLARDPRLHWTWGRRRGGKSRG